jgi:hypothetical protein
MTASRKSDLEDAGQSSKFAPITRAEYLTVSTSSKFPNQDPITQDQYANKRQSVDPKAKLYGRDSPLDYETMANHQTVNYQVKADARGGEYMKDILDWNVSNSNAKIGNGVKENLGGINKQMGSNPLEHMSYNFPAKMETTNARRGGPSTGSKLRRREPDEGCHGVPVHQRECPNWPHHWPQKEERSWTWRADEPRISHAGRQARLPFWRNQKKQRGWCRSLPSSNA